MKLSRSALIALLATCLAAGAVSTLDPTALQFNDSTAPTDVVMKNGHAYIPVTAVAKLLNASVVMDGSIIKFVPLDNSRQVNGDEGKVGEMVRLGYANFTVKSVNTGGSYHAKYGGSDSTADAGQKIVSIEVHIQNSTLKSQICYVLGGDKTALADTMGRSYRVSAINSDFGPRGVDLLPGAATDLVLIFNVPQDVVLKDLVYEVNFVQLTKLKVARVHLQ
jgi:hypothetical protein